MSEFYTPHAPYGNGLSQKVTCAGGLTALRCEPGHSATKTWRRHPGAVGWIKTDYKAGSRFQPTQYVFDDLAGLAALIERLAADPRTCIVRGALTEAGKAQPWVRRLLHARGKEAATLRPAARQWIMVDIDGYHPPAGIDLAEEPELAIDAAVYDVLPEAFHGAECFWQLSSSAGFVPGVLKAHLFFWLSEPADDTHIRAVLKQHAPGVDGAPFSPAQVHYIAAPVIEGGPDPLPRRTGWRRGCETAVVLPSLAQNAGGSALGVSDTAARSAGVAGALALLGDGPGLNGFHEPLRTATWRYARECRATGQRDDDALFAMLRAAIQAAPRDLKARPSVANYLSAEYLRGAVNGAFTRLETSTPAPVREAVLRVSLEAGRAVLAAGAVRFRDAVLNHAPEAVPAVLGMAITTGAGKSGTTRETAIVPVLEELRARGHQGRVVVAVPTVALGEDAKASFDRLEAFRAAGFRAEVYRGRERPDPTAPSEAMCKDLPAAKDALAAGANVKTAVCIVTANGVTMRCTRWPCPFTLQEDDAPDVWIVAHEYLTLPVQDAFGDVVAYIVDESPIKALVTPEAEVLTLHALEAMRDVPSGKLDTLVLEDTSRRAVDALRRAFANGARHVTRAMFDVVGVTAEEARHAAKLVGLRREKPAIHPGMDPEARAAAAARSENATVGRLVAFWNALADLLADADPAARSGWIGLQTDNTAEGPVPLLLLKGRKAVHADWLAIPCMHLDATMKPALLRQWWPTLEQIAEVHVEAPHEHNFQVLGAKFTAEAVLNSADKLQELRATVFMFGMRYAPHRVLAQFRKPVEEALKALGPLPANVETAHYYDMAGKDCWGPKANDPGVRAILQFDRPAAWTGDVERLAECVTGRAVDHAGKWYPQRPTHREMIDGSWLPAEADYHAHPVAEDLRSLGHEGQLIQGHGRGRGVLRTASNPLDVWMFHDTVLPLPLERVFAFADVAPGNAWRMMAEGGIEFTNRTHMADAYPQLWPTRNAAKLAMHGEAGREVGVSELNKGVSIKRGDTNLPAFAYQQQGTGKKPALARVDLSRHPDPAAALAALLGPLAWCRPADPAGVELAAEPAAPAAVDAPPVADAAPPLGAEDDDMPTPDAPASLIVLGEAVPFDVPAPLPPPIDPAPLTVVVSKRSRLAGLSARLEAARPAPVDPAMRLAMELMLRPGHRVTDYDRALSYFIARARNILAMRGEHQAASWRLAAA